jgi:hypothetical protein
MPGKSPIEEFLLHYTLAAGGESEEVEPQVYDLLLPDAEKTMRLVLDAEALAEHPQAEFLTFGSAVLERMLASGRDLGRNASVFVNDVHLTPYGLEQHVRRDIVLPEGIALRVESSRPLYVAHTLFCFEVTYMSDTKEQAVYTVGFDRYYGRQIRYLHTLLDENRCTESRGLSCPDAAAIALPRAYLLARDRLIRTLGPDANKRHAEVRRRLEGERRRMSAYYRDMRDDLLSRQEKSRLKGEENESFSARLAALRREESLRLEEAENKGTLRAQLRLTNVLHIAIPRLFLRVCLLGKQPHSAASLPEVQCTWDPITERTDAIDCPSCGTPTLALTLTKRNAVVCPGSSCAGSAR